jgi:deoxycytidylate deaminase
MYVALFPCNECAKVIIQSGIKEVVFMSDKYSETNSMKASRKMMNMAKVPFYVLRQNNFHFFFFAQVDLRHYEPNRESVTIDFSTINNGNNQSKKKRKLSGSEEQKQSEQENELPN